MRLESGSLDILSAEEVARLHGAALRILDEVGMEIESAEMRAHLAEHGGRIDAAGADARVRFSPAVVHRFLTETETVDWATLEPRVTASAGVYHSAYLEPGSNALLPWSEALLADYAALARQLPHIESAHLLGCNLAVPAPLEPLYERYYAWKIGAQESGSIHLDALCPYILELCALRAEHLGRPIEQVFRGSAYLVPALKLGRHEAVQFLYFWQRGLRVSLGDMYAMGATAPVTAAGSLALWLAEQLALGMVQRAFFGGRTLGLGCSISPMDMRTAIYAFGRPEMSLNNLAMAQMARFYGLPFSGHGGLTTAKLPSAEVGAQKALTAIPALMASGRIHIDAGLLSLDEICSPVQMILDNELASALAHLCRSYAVDDETLALDLIAELGPGGHYLPTEHTARHYRRELWEPHVWSRQMLGDWLEEGRPLDADRATAWFHDTQRERQAAPSLDEAEEREILALIERAAEAAI